jgi:hypothetical protein
LLWYLLPRYGIFGVAVAWAVRAVVDAALLLATSRTLLSEAAAPVRRVSLWLGATTIAVAAMAFVPWAGVRYAIAAMCVPAWLAASWWMILTPEERLSPARALRVMAGSEP